MITLGSPRINEPAVVEAVDNRAGGVAQHNAAFPSRDDAVEVGHAAGKLGSAEPLVGRERSLVARGRHRSVAHHRIDRVTFGQRARQRYAGAERLNRLITRVGKGCRRLKADPRSPIAERKVGRMVELERSGEAEACAKVHHCFIADMSLGKGRRKVQAGAAGAGPGNGGDDHCLQTRWSADVDFVTHGKAIRPANSDTVRACIGRAHEIRARSLNADLGDRHGLDAMANAVDIEPDLVADRDVGYRRDFNVGRTRRRVCAKISLRALLADRGNSRHLVLLNGTCDGGIGRAVTESNLLADLEAVDAGDGHVGRSGGDGDHRTLGEGLPERRIRSGSRPDACNFARLRIVAGADADGIAGRRAVRVPDVDGGISSARGCSESGVGEAK